MIVSSRWARSVSHFKIKFINSVRWNLCGTNRGFVKVRAYDHTAVHLLLLLLKWFFHPFPLQSSIPATQLYFVNIKKMWKAHISQANIWSWQDYIGHHFLSCTSKYTFYRHSTDISLFNACLQYIFNHNGFFSE